MDIMCLEPDMIHRMGLERNHTLEVEADVDILHEEVMSDIHTPMEREE